MDGIVSEVAVGSGLEVTVQEQQRQVKHEKGEGGIENNDSYAKNLFWHLEPCVYVTRMRSVNVTVHAPCAEKCACNRSVYVQKQAGAKRVEDSPRLGAALVTFVHPSQAEALGTRSTCGAAFPPHRCTAGMSCP